MKIPFKTPAGVWSRIACLLVAALVPACGQTKSQTAPSINASLPPPGSAGVPLQTIIYIDWDRDLDPTSVSTSTFTLTDNLGNAKTVTVGYNSLLDQVSMVPSSALAPSTTYTVAIENGVTPITGQIFTGGFFNFTTMGGTDSTQPVFTGGLTSAAPTATAGQITLVWPTATDGADGDGITYDIYMSLTSLGEDFSAPPFMTTSASTGTTLSGFVSGVTYYFMVRARENTSGNIDFNVTERSAVPK